MFDIEEYLDEKELFDGRYKLLKTLSTDGGTADVWLAIDVNTIDNPELLGEEVDEEALEKSGMLVAIKVYRPKNALDIEGEQRFRDEYKIVHNCRHTNLLQPTNFSICRGLPYLELPYCKNGSSELLIKNDMGEKDIWKLVYDVASGLSYLHACTPPIIHQDIKPGNILIDDYNNYAITDFGISAQSGGKHGYYFSDENNGTMAYMAPERFNDDYTPIAESDIWAFGAMLYEILTGDVPYKEEGGKNQLECNIRTVPMSKRIPKDIQKLILSCLALNPQKRPTANQIIKIAEKHIATSKVFRNILLGLVAIIAAVGGYYILKPSDSLPIINVEAQYREALEKLGSVDSATVESGIVILERLASLSYAPAMYELARTYGWFDDSASKKRKSVLGIEHNDGLPILSKYNDRARDICRRIIELEDSTIPDFKANAAFKLAGYNHNDGQDLYVRSTSEALDDLLVARRYAEEAGNESLLDAANEFIDYLMSEMNEDNNEY